MASANIVLLEQHPSSGRYAILEEYRRCANFYLTRPTEEVPVTQVWVYNRPGPKPGAALNFLKMFAGVPPVPTAEYTGESIEIESAAAHRWSVRWSSDGEAAAIDRDGEPVAFVLASERQGCNRHLVKDSNIFGRVWSEEIYRNTFGI